MKILGIILARRGSKRLKFKNKKKLGQHPLFYWSVLSCKSTKKIFDFIVSTDDIEIINYCKKKNIKYVTRPKKISKDNTPSTISAIHAAKWYEKNFVKVDAILLLQPTSPFRSKKTIEKGIKKFYKKNLLPVVSVSKLKNNLKYIYNQKGSLLYKSKFNLNIKDKNFFYPNGLFYLIKFSDLIKNNDFLLRKMIPLEVESYKETIDIDEIEDLKLAKILINKKI